jgi:hypothetical protein
VRPDQRLEKCTLGAQTLWDPSGEQARANLLPGISVHELLFGVAYAHIVNAAFTHAHPAGSRFNRPERGAWYAASELETAQAEIALHKAQKSFVPHVRLHSAEMIS